MIKVLFKELNISTHNKLRLLQIIQLVPLNTRRISNKNCSVGRSLKVSALTIWNMYITHTTKDSQIRNVWSSTKQTLKWSLIHLSMLLWDFDCEGKLLCCRLLPKIPAVIWLGRASNSMNFESTLLLDLMK